MNKVFTLSKALIAACGLFCLPVSNVIGQDVTIDQGGIISSCTGNFYDSGGQTGVYSSSENHSMIFTSGLYGTNYELNFTSMDVEVGYDVIQIYDGLDASGTLLYDSDASNSANPGSIISTTGALYVNFTSDGSVQYDGWEATLGCVGTPINNEASLIQL